MNQKKEAIKLMNRYRPRLLKAFALKGDAGMEDAMALFGAFDSWKSGKGYAGLGRHTNTASLQNLQFNLEFLCQYLESPNPPNLNLTGPRLVKYFFCGSYFLETTLGGCRVPTCNIPNICKSCGDAASRKRIRNMLNGILSLGHGHINALTLGIPPMDMGQGWEMLKECEASVKYALHNKHKAEGGSHPAKLVMGYFLRAEFSVVDGKSRAHHHGLVKFKEGCDVVAAISWLSEKWHGEVCSRFGATVEGLVKCEPVAPEAGVSPGGDILGLSRWISYSNKSSPFAGGFGDRYGIGAAELASETLRGLSYFSSLDTRQSLSFSCVFGNMRKRIGQGSPIALPEVSSMGELIEAVDACSVGLAVVPWFTDADLRDIVGCGELDKRPAIMISPDADHAAHMVARLGVLGIPHLRIRSAMDTRKVGGLVNGLAGGLAVVSAEAFVVHAGALSGLHGRLSMVVCCDGLAFSLSGSESAPRGAEAIDALTGLFDHLPWLIQVPSHDRFSVQVFGAPDAAFVRQVDPCGVDLSVIERDNDSGLAEALSATIAGLVGADQEATILAYAGRGGIAMFTHASKGSVPNGLVEVWRPSSCDEDGSDPGSLFARGARLVIATGPVRFPVAGARHVIVADGRASLSGLGQGFRSLGPSGHGQRMIVAVSTGWLESKRRSLDLHHLSPSQTIPVLMVLAGSPVPLNAVEVGERLATIEMEHPGTGVGSLFVGRRRVDRIVSVLNALVGSGAVVRHGAGNFRYLLTSAASVNIGCVAEDLMHSSIPGRMDFKGFISFIKRGPKATINELVRGPGGPWYRTSSNHNQQRSTR